MAATQGKTGKAGNITINGNVIPIISWSAKQDISWADSTDSGNYQSATQSLPKSQLPGDSQMSGQIKGFYDAATTSANLTSLVKNPQNGPYTCVLKFDASTTYFNGSVDLTNDDFEVSVPGATMISFTVDWKSNGAYVLT